MIEEVLREERIKKREEAVMSVCEKLNLDLGVGGGGVRKVDLNIRQDFLASMLYLSGS
jgi:hypothetical protein